MTLDETNTNQRDGKCMHMFTPPGVKSFRCTNYIFEEDGEFCAEHAVCREEGCYMQRVPHSRNCEEHAEKTAEAPE